MSPPLLSPPPSTATVQLPRALSGWLLLGVALAGCAPDPTTGPSTPSASSTPHDDGGPRTTQAAGAASGTATARTTGATSGTPVNVSTTADAGPAEPVSESAAPRPAPPGMAVVPAGRFVMGADEGGEPDEHPAHEVTLEAFWLDVTEVTNEAYQECVRAQGCRPKDHRVGVFSRPLQPVTAVSWDDAVAYCAFRGKRLPTEAEYERAVRGDDGRRYPWGNEPPSLERTVALGQGGPEEVGSRPAGRGPYGHDDLAGNVWEWVADLYDPFAYQRPSASRGIPGTCEAIMAALEQIRREGKAGYTGTNPISSCERSIRGGAYNYPADGLRSSNRIHHPGSWRLRMTGIRCALSAE